MNIINLNHVQDFFFGQQWEKYNTLREIPDEYFRAYLKTKFASLFADDTHIDISKPMDLVSKGEDISNCSKLIL